MCNFRRLFIYLFAACGVFLTSLALAQNGAHFNNAELRREGNRTVAVTLHLNWPQVLHQLLASHMVFKVFLKTYSELPEPQLEREMSKLHTKLTTNAYLTLTSGARVNFKKWQVPNNLALRESLKLSLMLIDMPVNAQAHIDPVRVTAKAQSKNVLTQVQIQLPIEFYPILVHSKNDKFWLTEQIPLAVISF